MAQGSGLSLVDAELVRTDPAAVGRAREALDELEATWRGRVDRMADLLTTPTRGEDR